MHERKVSLIHTLSLDSWTHESQGGLVRVSESERERGRERNWICDHFFFFLFHLSSCRLLHHASGFRLRKRCLRQPLSRSLSLSLPASVLQASVRRASKRERERGRETLCP